MPATPRKLGRWRTVPGLDEIASVRGGKVVCLAAMETEAPEERRTIVGVVDDADAAALAAGGFRTVRFGRAEEAVAAAARGDVARVMLRYGAVTAGNLDGGSSSVMVCGGDIVNFCSSVTGPRYIPTGFIVLPEGESHA